MSESVYYPDTVEVCQMIDKAPQELRDYAQQEQAQQIQLSQGLGCSISGWSYGAAKSAALYMVRELGSYDIDTSDVCWHTVAEHLDTVMPCDEETESC